MPIESINSISSNNSAQRAANIFSDSSFRLQKAIARFSSGLRIVSPADDAGSLSQLIKLESQISRTTAAEVNLGNAVSFSQTQDGHLQTAQRALDRMGELSVLAQDPTKTDADRALLQEEFTQLQEMVSNVGGATFNGVNLFSSSGTTVTTDPNGETTELAAIDPDAAGNAGGLADVSGASIATSADAANALDTIQTAIGNLSSLRANVGANLQQLNATTETVGTLNENLSAAASRIGDLDFASGSTELSTLQTLVKAGAFQIGAANQLPKSTLQLLA